MLYEPVIRETPLTDDQQSALAEISLDVVNRGMQSTYVKALEFSTARTLDLIYDELVHEDPCDPDYPEMKAEVEERAQEQRAKTREAIGVKALFGFGIENATIRGAKETAALTMFKTDSTHGSWLPNTGVIVGFHGEPRGRTAGRTEMEVFGPEDVQFALQSVIKLHQSGLLYSEYATAESLTWALEPKPE